MPNILTPRTALNKAFLKQKPYRADIEQFKANFKNLLSQIDTGESEEFHKNALIDFLKNTWYSPGHYINTKGRTDLVIHNEKTAKSNVGVIVEAKSPANQSEMVSRDNLNAKAFHELLLYFLRERITHGNKQIRHLVITNVYEWFIFDAAEFEQVFASNKELVNEFKEFEEKRLSGYKTNFSTNRSPGPFSTTWTNCSPTPILMCGNMKGSSIMATRKRTGS